MELLAAGRPSVAEDTRGECNCVCVRVRVHVSLMRAARAKGKWQKSGHPESNQGPSDSCNTLQSDAPPTEL